MSKTAFYEVAATVIPVLLIALMLQTSYLDGEDHRGQMRRVVGIVGISGLSVIAEAMAMRALWTGHHANVSRWVIAAAIYGLIVALLNEFVHKALENVPDADQRRVQLMLIVGTTVVAAASWLILVSK